MSSFTSLNQTNFNNNQNISHCTYRWVLLLSTMLPKKISVLAPRSGLYIILLLHYQRLEHTTDVVVYKRRKENKETNSK